ncbi:DUF1818 family protein [Cyanobium sp. HWJ4-Hawea]|uniref:DUF1818 family protein n=1 Tax=Cyanobium sp. HWJ4-Hawea TaxID=2823713 RepID=UPI0020CE878B|nr:DUF1818 family protein [Cyanobium sp. HWJ4-Hawea]MCP9807958.1 DUF1818 family protein [Cyanobium sp. HWJ4-Hawea]
MLVQQGEGWRFLVDPGRHPYVVLVGGCGWATELTAAEAQELLQGVAKLQSQHGDLADQLMAEESITLEWELGELWLELEGDRNGWGLRFLLSPEAMPGPGPKRRAVEGSWSQGAAPAFAQALAAGLAGFNPA